MPREFRCGRSALSGTAGIQLVNRFREVGHLWAELDPLKRCKGPLARTPHTKGYWWREDPNRPGATQVLRNTSSRSGRLFVPKSVIENAGGPWWPREKLESFLERAYCGSISVEASHLLCPKKRKWWYRAAEQERASWLPSPARQRGLFVRLLSGALLPRFLRSNFPATKWFGLEGCDALVPGLFKLAYRSAEHGVQAIELGMAHRGRLSVLRNLLDKPLGLICAEMHENRSSFHVGDVKYHTGFTGKLATLDESWQTNFGAYDFEGAPPDLPTLSITPNPSHLELIGPVVLGKVRALQDRLGEGDEGRRQALGVIIHGDAAISASGICYEAMQLAQLDGYHTGGSVHVIVNNQIGFTTMPREGRSTPHPSDVAKAVDVPVIHVNADDIDGVDRAFTLAADWRAEFGADVVVDLVGYRRFGHNESDRPDVSHPSSYSLVKKLVAAEESYGKQLVDSGILDADAIPAMREKIDSKLLEEFEGTDTHKEDGIDWMLSVYRGRLDEPGKRKPQITGVPLGVLHHIAEAAFTAPEHIAPHSDVAKLLDKRRAMVRKNGQVDFATAEQLAFCSILLHRDVWDPTGGTGSWKTSPSEKLPCRNVRLTGQDCMRGTFNQRHLNIASNNGDGETVEMLPQILTPGNQARFSAYNSPLNEAAALAFEYGYSIGDTDSLVCWEAQFGDFANCAQAVIDEFIVSGEAKWDQPSGITLLLPHGYDGQGPNHSSARIERFLQLTNDDPNHLPGASPKDIHDIDRAFDIIDVTKNGTLDERDVRHYIERLPEFKGKEFENAWELWLEVTRQVRPHVTEGINRNDWRAIMQQLHRRNAERNANIFVLNVSTPAQYFHVLRRQAHRNYKKPLILMTPKYLLHHAKARSALSDFGEKKFFQRVICDDSLSTTKPMFANEFVDRVILCSGQIYYHLLHTRSGRKIENAALVRLEQVSPFPYDLIVDAISRYPNADVVWCQEEPKNMGAWFYVQPRLATAIQHRLEVKYIGRPASAVTATGSFAIDREELRLILDTAFRL